MSDKETGLFKERFARSVVEKCLVKPEDNILVAVSGGADSMALLHLFLETGHKIVVAHCNFLLRNSESDEDELFVKDFCEKRKIEVRIKKFDTLGYAAKNKKSIEMAARELRYNWFNELLGKDNLTYIATGHNGDDAVETFFLNLTRGTGLKGLKGISWRRDKIIRPLLFAKKTEILSYCKSMHLFYRTDSSNSDTGIIRNKIRHKVIPLFAQINTSFFNTMQLNMEFLAEAYEFLSVNTENFKNQFVAEEEGLVLIPVTALKGQTGRKSILFELLRPYGFNSDVIGQIIDGLGGIPGKQYFSDEYRLIRDRFNLILVKKGTEPRDIYYIEAGCKLIENPVEIKISVFNKEPDFKYSKNPNIAHLDADKIDFPLELRKWNAGDHFQPLGMSKFKKISDFFIDEKYSLIEKERTWLLISNGDVIWVMGKRLDNRFKITPRTLRVMEVSIDLQKN